MRQKTGGTIMALAPYNEILTILNTANNLFSALENRFTQKS